MEGTGRGEGGKEHGRQPGKCGIMKSLNYIKGKEGRGGWHEDGGEKEGEARREGGKEKGRYEGRLGIRSSHFPSARLRTVQARMQIFADPFHSGLAGQRSISRMLFRSGRST